MKPVAEREVKSDEEFDGRVGRAAGNSSARSGQRISRTSSPTRPNGASGARAKTKGGDNGITDHPFRTPKEIGVMKKRMMSDPRASFSGDEEHISQRPKLEHHSRQPRTAAWILSQETWISRFGSCLDRERNSLVHDECGRIGEQLQDVCNNAERGSSDKMTCRAGKSSLLAKQNNGKLLEEELGAIGAWTAGSASSSGLFTYSTQLLL
jgi:hypothetical protein